MRILFSASLLYCASLFGVSHILEYDEVGTMESLIAATRSSLEKQEIFLKALIEFKKARSDFLIDPTSAKLATALVKKAMRISEQLEANRWHHLFPPSFIEEVKFFNSVGEQKNLTRGTH